ncbi:hypothetical protein BJX99DRAFT_226456 [Aspergillus californicus]
MHQSLSILTVVDFINHSAHGFPRPRSRLILYTYTLSTHRFPVSKVHFEQVFADYNKFIVRRWSKIIRIGIEAQ